jgi:hypothetical protein
MKKFTMTRVEPPEWATAPGLEITGVSVPDYEEIQRRRNEMLDIVQQEVESYLNDPQLYFDGNEDGFPHRQRLTGAYYIGGESYDAHTNPAWIQIRISCHCLEPLRSGLDREDDYLGLDVWIKCVPGRWSFSVCGNTDSSSI